MSAARTNPPDCRSRSTDRRQLQQAVPSAQVTSVSNVFDGLAELAGERPAPPFSPPPLPSNVVPKPPCRRFVKWPAITRSTAVWSSDTRAAQPKDARLRRSADDYLVTPVNTAELQQLSGQPHLRIAGGANRSIVLPPSLHPASCNCLPVCRWRIFSWTRWQYPGGCAEECGAASHQRADQPRVSALSRSQCAIAADAARWRDTPVPCGARRTAKRRHIAPAPAEVRDHAAARHMLAAFRRPVRQIDRRAGHAFGARQRLAMTDELTGVYNGRYFKHFLARFARRR